MANPIKPSLKTELLPLILIFLSLASACYLYKRLPETMPVHWNLAGEVDGWGSGQAHAVMFPLLIIGLYALFLLIPYLDPKKDRYEQFAKIYHIFKSVIMFFLFIIYGIASLNGLGYYIPVGISVAGMVGILFIIIGNYLGKIKPNWFMGIRTPWTLSSEEVWNKTHRLGGKIFIIAGLIMIITPLLPLSWRLPVFILNMLMIIFGTVISSYIIYLKESAEQKARADGKKQ